MNSLNIIQKITIWALPVLLAIIVHEVAHGWVAKLLGDRTAYNLGRLTLNPIKHIDVMGTIIVPLLCLLAGSFVFGWAKPVPINCRNFKHYKRDTALVAIAGPISNFLMVIMWAIFIKMLIILFNEPSMASLSLTKLFFIQMGYAGISINLLLMVLNLVPIPPLDGSRVVSSILPLNLATYYGAIERYGFIILLILMYTNILYWVLEPPLAWMQKGIFDFFVI